jgi:hypothetical protein
VLYFSQKWLSTNKIKYAIGLGLFLGWSLITRPVDFAIVLIPLLWFLNIEKPRNRLQFLVKNKKHILACITSCLAVATIQLLYWRFTTGHLIHFSYEEEGFNFGKPEIINGLFSFKKGWFIYTPIAFLAFFGLIPLFKYQKQFFLPVITFYIAFIYIVFSWWMWYYGWSFGSRPMIETYAVLSLPLAALLNWIAQQNVVWKSFFLIVFCFFIWLNIYQTIQFNLGTLHGDNMTQQFYWRIWNKLHPSPEDWKYFGK